MKSEENYFFGELNGLSKYYSENGKLNKTVNYLYGSKHGLTQEYDNNEKLISSQNYLYGELIE